MPAPIGRLDRLGRESRLESVVVATLRELFAAEFSMMKLDAEVTFSTQGEVLALVTARVYVDFDACVRFMGYFVPAQ